MWKAVLICFGYDGSSQKLPGILLDMYRIYNALESYNKIVITDIENDLDAGIVRSLEIDTRADLLTFVQKIKGRNEYVPYSSMASMKTHIEKYITSASRSIIYYTGHVEKGNILLPASIGITLRGGNVIERPQDVISVNWLIGIGDGSRLIIIDSCEAGQIDLPFHLPINSVGRYHRSSSENYSNGRVIVLSSTRGEEKAMARVDGSDFTKCLIECTKRGEYYIPHVFQLLVKQAVNRTPSLYLSHPNIYSIREWFQTNSINITYNHSTNSFELQT